MDPFYLAILVYVLAVVLAIIDLFIPSGGMLLILAVFAAVGSVLLGFRSSYNTGLGMMALAFCSVPAFAVLAIKIWPMTPIGKRIILQRPQSKKGDLTDSVEHDALIGAVVSTASPLMPTGQIQVGHRRLGATAKTGIIESGQRVRVLDFRERNFVVEPTNDPLTERLGTRLSEDSTTKHPASPTDPAGPPATPQEKGKLLETSDPERLLDIPAEDLGLDSLDD